MTTRRHRSLDLEWLNLEAIYEGFFENPRAHSVGESDFLHRRSSARQLPNSCRNLQKGEGEGEESPQELLRCLLVAKDVLKKKNKDPSAAILAALEMSQGFEREHSTTQQLTLKRQTLIRQRKNSTAIKVASLEKRKSLQFFKDGEKESLQRRLTALDLELKENERVAEIQRKRLFTRHNSDISALRDLGGIELVDSDSGCSMKSTEFYRGSLPSLDALSMFDDPLQEKKKIFGFFDRRRTTRGEKRFRHILDSKIWKNRKQKSSDNLATKVMRSSINSNSSLPNKGVSAAAAGGMEPNSPATGGGGGGDVRPSKGCSPQLHLLQSKPRIRTNIDPNALEEIEKFKILVSKYFSLMPQDKRNLARMH